MEQKEKQVKDFQDRAHQAELRVDQLKRDNARLEGPGA